MSVQLTHLLVLTMNFNSDFFKWIEDHKDDNPDRLRLKYLSKGNHADWLPVAISHISSMKKAGAKLLDEERRELPEVLYPEIALEQCSSLDTARIHLDILKRYFPEGSLNIADLTFGLGIDSREFLNAGHHVTAVERNETIYETALFNYRHENKLILINGDSAEFIDQTDRHWDIIFIDPDRRGEHSERIYDIGRCSPDIFGLMPQFRRKCDVLMIKMSPMADIRQTLISIPFTTHLYVIAAKGECKEITVVVDFRAEHPQQPEVVPISVIGKEMPELTFNIEEEKELKKAIQYVTPREGYLFVPSPALLKAGCFNVTAIRFGVNPISANTHLYSSESLAGNFPGKTYLIKRVEPFSRQGIKNIKETTQRADISVRNFPLTSSQLSAKLKMKSDNTFHLFACRDAKDTLIMILCEKISR